MTKDEEIEKGITGGHGVKTLEKALRLLETLARRQPVGVTSLARELGVPKSQVSRFLKTLAQLGYAAKLPGDRRFVLGQKARELARVAGTPRELIARAAKPLENLAREAQASAHLAILEGRDVLIVAKADSPARLQLTSSVGQRSQPHCSALGKVLLAGLPDEERKIFLENYPFQVFTPHTITKREDMEKILKSVQRKGYAEENEEEHLGVGCLAAPILDGAGQIIAALSISGPLVGTPFAVDRANTKRIVKYATALTNDLAEGGG